MSSRLDSSLDEIIAARRTGNHPRRSARRPASARTGGVTKNTATRSARPTKHASAAPSTFPPKRESKILLSNMPHDVDEKQIKEYFSEAVGPVKSVHLNYTKSGRSSGVATIVFSNPEAAAIAAKSYNGIKVDGRPMKIEVIVGAQQVPEPPAPKSMMDRITAPKNAAAKPKPAGNAKGNTKPAANAAGAGAGARGGKKAGRGGRTGGARPKKTAEELDADMQDYFDANGAPAADGALAIADAPNVGEAAMEDEIS